MDHESRGRCIIISHTRFKQKRPKGERTSPVNFEDAMIIADCFGDSLGFKDIRIYTDYIDSSQVDYGSRQVKKACYEFGNLRA